MTTCCIDVFFRASAKHGNGDGSRHGQETSGAEGPRRTFKARLVGDALVLAEAKPGASEEILILAGGEAQLKGFAEQSAAVTLVELTGTEKETHRWASILQGSGDRDTSPGSSEDHKRRISSDLGLEDRTALAQCNEDLKSENAQLRCQLETYERRQAKERFQELEILRARLAAATSSSKVANAVNANLLARIAKLEESNAEEAKALEDFMKVAHALEDRTSQAEMAVLDRERLNSDLETENARLRERLEAIVQKPAEELQVADADEFDRRASPIQLQASALAEAVWSAKDGRDELSQKIADAVCDLANFDERQELPDSPASTASAAVCNASANSDPTQESSAFQRREPRDFSATPTSEETASVSSACTAKAAPVSSGYLARDFRDELSQVPASSSAYACHGWPTVGAVGDVVDVDRRRELLGHLQVPTAEAAAAVCNTCAAGDAMRESSPFQRRESHASSGVPTSEEIASLGSAYTAKASRPAPAENAPVSPAYTAGDCRQEAIQEVGRELPALRQAPASVATAPISGACAEAGQDGGVEHSAGLQQLALAEISPVSVTRTWDASKIERIEPPGPIEALEQAEIAPVNSAGITADRREDASQLGTRDILDLSQIPALTAAPRLSSPFDGGAWRWQASEVGRQEPVLKEPAPALPCSEPLAMDVSELMQGLRLQDPAAETGHSMFFAEVSLPTDPMEGVPYRHSPELSVLPPPCILEPPTMDLLENAQDMQLPVMGLPSLAMHLEAESSLEPPATDPVERMLELERTETLTQSEVSDCEAASLGSREPLSVSCQELQDLPLPDGVSGCNAAFSATQPSAIVQIQGMQVSEEAPEAVTEAVLECQTDSSALELPATEQVEDVQDQDLPEAVFESETTLSARESVDVDPPEQTQDPIRQASDAYAEDIEIFSKDPLDKLQAAEKLKQTPPEVEAPPSTTEQCMEQNLQLAPRSPAKVRMEKSSNLETLPLSPSCTFESVQDWHFAHTPSEPEEPSTAEPLAMDTLEDIQDQNWHLPDSPGDVEESVQLRDESPVHLRDDESERTFLREEILLSRFPDFVIVNGCRVPFLSELQLMNKSAESLREHAEYLYRLLGHERIGCLIADQDVDLVRWVLMVQRDHLEPFRNRNAKLYRQGSGGWSKEMESDFDTILDDCSERTWLSSQVHTAVGSLEVNMSSPRRHLADRGGVLQDAFKRFSMERTASAPSSLAFQLQAALASAASGEIAEPPKAARSARGPGSAVRRMSSLGGTPWQAHRSMLQRDRVPPQAHSPQASPPAAARVLSTRASIGGPVEAAALSKQFMRQPVRRMVTTPACASAPQSVSVPHPGSRGASGVSTYSPAASPNINTHRPQLGAQNGQTQHLPYDEAEAAIAKAAQMLDKVNHLPRRSHTNLSPLGGKRTTRSVSPRPGESYDSSKRQRPTNGDPPMVPPKVPPSPATVTRTFVSPRNSMRNVTTVPVVPPLALNKANQQVFTTPGSPKGVSPRVLVVSSVSPRHSLAKPVIASVPCKGSATVPVTQRQSPRQSPLPPAPPPQAVTSPSPPGVTSPPPPAARQTQPPTVNSPPPPAARQTLPPTVASPPPPPHRQTLPPGSMSPPPPMHSAQPNWNTARYTIPAKPQQRLPCMNRGSVRHQSGARTPSPIRARLQGSSSVTNMTQQAPGFASVGSPTIGCRSGRGA